MKKVVIAIDSFKGCLSSIDAGEAVAAGVRNFLPNAEIVVMPIADGGEGMQDVLITATHGQRIVLKAYSPLMELQETSYGISGDGETAFIEMASISGLPLVPEGRRNPMQTTSFGTGELIKDALTQGCRKFIIGLGGSATNDAGLGMLQALGFRFYNREGKEVGGSSPLCGALLSEVYHIDCSLVHSALSNSRFTVACDVRNPFCGPEGATHAFAPQKGANQDMVTQLEASMQHLVKVIRQYSGKDIASVPGAGAAGGMGGALLAFLKAELKPGIDLLLDALHFSEKIQDADLILTGEGKADRQTLMGKVPLGVLYESMKQQIPVVLLAGSIEATEELNRAGFLGVFSILPSPVDLKQAINPIYTRDNLRRTAEQVCRLLSFNTTQKH
ncbi:glycerate kinase [Porphyromonas circumdentaria]|uniref:Glycerate kinase n=1 Tax=Porphyromonas circumdentaria TaxID=29524 RepID=A0A1T4LFB9_9PORP|nr:glycerate kinase [Porphyromonas circumdentaria]MBB6275282.1 glycerate kinase [Porphyromonas circumdentaria]SJZ53267.1 glycerate kinase [Porphyromonas circumdentaria]